jgi:HD-like signal output (HDOD) protein
MTCEHLSEARRGYEEIKATASLPSPTGVALHVLELVRDESTSIYAIASAVESDPAMASRVLKLVNSPLVGTTRKIVSISRAVALLGIRTVTGLALGFSLVSNNRTGPCADFDYDLFWSESLGQGVAARHLAARLHNFAADEAFACGLLCQIGRLALAVVRPQPGLGAHGAESRDRDPSENTEEATFDIDSYDLAAEMMADWHMPEIFRSAVRAQKDLSAAEFEIGSRIYQFAHMLHLAGAVARVLPRSTVYRDTVSQILLEANRLGIAPDAYHEVFDAISREWREAGAVFSIRTRHVPPLEEIYTLARERQTVLECEEPTQKSVPGGECHVRRRA